MGYTRQIGLFSSLRLTVLLWIFYPLLMGSFCTYFFERTSHFLAIRITYFDFFLIGFIPHWVYLAQRQKPERSRQLAVFRLLLFCLVTFFFGGVWLAIQIDYRSSPLLPAYLIEEPFRLYYTLLNLLAIGIPLIYFKAWRGAQTSFRDSVEKDDELLI